MDSSAVRNLWLFLLLIGGFYLGRSWYFAPKLTTAEPAPALIAPTTDGATFNLSEQGGQYVYLNFWGSWCGPCLAKIPELQKLHQSLAADRFQLVHIAVEDRAERHQAALQRYELPGIHLLDLNTSLRFFDGTIAKQFGVKQLPTGYLIGPEGDILAYNPSVEEIVATVGK